MGEQITHTQPNVDVPEDLLTLMLMRKKWLNQANLLKKKRHINNLGDKKESKSQILSMPMQVL